MDVPWIKSNPNRSGSCPIGVLFLLALSLTLIPACLQARSAKAERYFKKALRLSEKGDMDRARVAYDAALTIDPDFAETRVNRGRIHLFNEALEDAGSDLTHALSVSPGDVEALILRSRVFQAQGRLGEAMEDLSASMAGAGGQDPEKLFMRANLLYELKDSDNARLDLEAASAICLEETRAMVAEVSRLESRGNGAAGISGKEGPTRSIGELAPAPRGEDVAPTHAEQFQAYQAELGKQHLAATGVSDSALDRLRALLEERRELYKRILALQRELNTPEGEKENARVLD
jgi:tetratricopeptide (TPR) repeat protein